MSPVDRLQQRLDRVLVARGEVMGCLTVTCRRTVTVDPVLRPLGEWMAQVECAEGDWHALKGSGWGETEGEACEALWGEVLIALRAMVSGARKNETLAARRLADASSARLRAESVLALALDPDPA